MGEQIQWLSLLIAFLSGLVLAFIGALAAYFFQRRSDKKKHLEQIQFEIYMRVLELHGLYFRVYSAEVRKKEIPPETREKIWTLAWKTSDVLRTADGLRHTPQILDVLFSNKYETAEARYNAMQDLIDELGNSTDPRFIKAMKRIGAENQKLLLKDIMKDSNAPGFIV